MGKLLRYFLPLRISHGDGVLWSIGVVRRHNMARCGSWPLSLAFVKSCFTVCTILSANPFERGYIGEDVACSNLQFVANCLNSSDEYCGPLSDTKHSGIPCSSKIPLRWLITDRELIVCNFRTTGNLLNASATNRYWLCSQWNRSELSVCHGRGGTSRGMSGSLLADGWWIWHWARELTSLSMFRLMPSQNTDDLALKQHFSTPWCA